MECYDFFGRGVELRNMNYDSQALDTKIVETFNIQPQTQAAYYFEVIDG